MNSIFHRISVRKYEDRPVEKEKIMEILRAGMQAPSACNQQPWEFYVVTDKEKIQKLSKVTPYTGCATGAPVVIVPVYRTEGLVAPSFAQIDMAIAQENIWLETDAQGLGGVWFGIAVPSTQRTCTGYFVSSDSSICASQAANAPVMRRTGTTWHVFLIMFCFIFPLFYR